MTTIPAQTRIEEVSQKVARVRELLESRGLDGALLTTQAGVSWLTAGLENPVIRGVDPGLVWALVTRDRMCVLTQNVEAPRVRAEESPAELGFEVREHDWYSGDLASLATELCAPGRLATDGAGVGHSMSQELQELRLQLTDGEQARFRELGYDACEALETVASTWVQGTTERQVAGRIAEAMETRGIFPSVLLVGSDARRRSFRHPTPSNQPTEHDVLLVVVGVRQGLNIALSRTVSQGTPEPLLAERHAVACGVEAEMIVASRPGASWGEAAQAGADAYTHLGYPDEWRHHYQGGPIGYATREFMPVPLDSTSIGSAQPVMLNQAFAWNPSVQGAKSEDTFLVGESGNEAISNSSTWPMVPLRVGDSRVDRPGILEL